MRALLHAHLPRGRLLSSRSKLNGASSAIVQSRRFFFSSSSHQSRLSLLAHRAFARANLAPTYLLSSTTPSVPLFVQSGIRRLGNSSAMQADQPRRFAPLDTAKSGDGLPRLKGVVFDVDGTLCEPQNYMFGEMRAALGIDKSTDILDHIYELPSEEQDPAFEKIRAIERRAMASQKPQGGLVELMDYLDDRGVPKGICTRNFDTPVTHLLTRFLAGHHFHPIVTRDFRPPKPDPAGILHISRTWGLEGSDVIMVGDSLDDMTAGHRAGAATVLLVNEHNAHLATHEHTDLCVRRLDELIGVLENGFVGQIGQGDEEPDTRAQAEEALKRS